MSEYTYEIKWAHELGLTQTNTSNTLDALDCVDTIRRAETIGAMREMYHAAEKWLQEAEDDTIKARAESCMATLVEMKLRVEKLPSAERRGKWEKKWHSAFKQEIPCCSECHNFMAFRWDYCPNCGAKMEGDCNESKVYTATPKGRTILERIKAGEGLPPLGAEMEGDE